MVNLVKNFLILLFFLLLGALTTIGYRKWGEGKQTREPKVVLKPIQDSKAGPSDMSGNFSLENPPSNSLKGKVAAQTGQVFWKSRVATESSSLSPETRIQQGEEVETGEGGNLTIEFAGVRSLNILSKSRVNVIQTLPDNLVFQQTDGTVIYKNTSGLPLAVRSLGLLTQFVSGEVKITINKSTSIVTLEVTKGSATAAYNDLKFISHTLTINEGKVLTFNNPKKKASVKG